MGGSNLQHAAPAKLTACPAPQIQRKLWIATSLAFIFMIAEVIGGYLASR
jgi:Co/Zn/Cd efflux system component